MSTDTPDSVKDKFYLCDRIAQLERELNEAKARITRLEEAGGKLHDALWSVQDWSGTAVSDAADEWVRAFDCDGDLEGK